MEENGETAFILTQDIIDSFKKSVGTAVYVSENGFGGQDGVGVYIDGGTFTIRKKKKACVSLRAHAEHPCSELQVWRRTRRVQRKCPCRRRSFFYFQIPFSVV